jgi:quinolinate synthase
MDEGKKVIWAPDKHLGSYIQKTTGADMLMWDAACIVHEEFKARGLADMRKLYPNAAILAHPESPSAVLEIADLVGSTTQIINAAQQSEKSEIIVATDQGIFHRLRQIAPEKKFILAPTAGNDATCRSCAQCPWMGMNSLESLYDSLHKTGNEIHVGSALAAQAMIPLQRMLDFAANNQLKVRGKA